MSTSKKSLLKRYCDHPLEIFKEKDLAKGYICSICNQIIFNAFSDKCNHTFCQDCILKHVREHGNCPVSGDPLTLADIKLSLLYINIIENLEVVCVHAGQGCKWQGKCREIDLHVRKNCQFTVVKCKFKGCDFKGEKRLMNNHFIKCRFRQTKCRYCRQIMAYDELMRHSKKCKTQEMECFLGCGKLINRKTKKEHEINECPFFKVNCEYKQFGCTFVSKRVKMVSHLESEDSFHFHCKLIRKRLEQVADLTNIKKNMKNNFVKLLPKNFSNDLQHSLDLEKLSVKSIDSTMKSVKERTEESETDSIKVDFDKQSIKSLSFKLPEWVGSSLLTQGSACVRANGVSGCGRISRFCALSPSTIRAPV